ncbi:cyclic lactone autoinducer peptide [Caproiciproducens sp.]|uniref:cyclic lactone autoinducer peptide n=1 Tax=Caproiciproducens sp. TaxID=1954376 RepID=UPI00289A503C|nr:cyclic lactone autoinducer peptide [Caproiciproducens sp.]
MKSKKSIQIQALKLVSKVAIYEARKSANTSCVALAYQPKLPDAAKRLRKF